MISTTTSSNFQPPRKACSSISDSSSALAALAGGPYSFRPPMETAARVALGPEGPCPVSQNKLMPPTMAGQTMYVPRGLPPSGSSYTVQPSRGMYNVSPSPFSTYASGSPSASGSPAPQSARVSSSGPLMQNSYVNTSYMPPSASAFQSTLKPSAAMSVAYNRPLQSSMMGSSMMGSSMMGSSMMNRSVAISQDRNGPIQAPPGSYRSDISGFYPNVIPEEYYSFHISEEEENKAPVQKSVSAKPKKSEMLMSKIPHHSHTQTGALDATTNFTSNQMKTHNDVSHYTTSMATGQLTIFDNEKEAKKQLTKKPLKKETRTPSQVKKSQAGCCDDFCGSSSPKEKTSVTVKKSSHKTH